MRKKYCVTFPTMTRQYYENGWLGKYSKEKGISAFIKSEDDCYHSPSSWFDSPIEIGQEIKKAGNILIVGKTRNLEHMIRKLIVNPEKVSKPSYVSNDDEFIQEMSEHNEKDGADFFDCDKSCIYRVGLLKDRKGRKTFSNIRYSDEGTFPQEYLLHFDNLTGKLTTEPGSRTDAIIKASIAFPNCHFYGTFETVHSKLGTGLVCHIQKGIVLETYLLDKLTGNTTKFIVQDKKTGNKITANMPEAIGTYKRYVDDKGRKHQNKHKKVIAFLNSSADHNLFDETGKQVHLKFDCENYNKPLRPKGRSIH